LPALSDVRLAESDCCAAAGLSAEAVSGAFWLGVSVFPLESASVLALLRA